MFYFGHMIEVKATAMSVNVIITTTTQVTDMIEVKAIRSHVCQGNNNNDHACYRYACKYQQKGTSRQ